MPHLHLETTADLNENADVPDILEALAEATGSLEGIERTHLRAFHSLRSVWFVGSGAPPGFVHLTLGVPGARTQHWKAHATQVLANILRYRFAYSLENSEASITIELQELALDSYHRFQ
jgi:5-carboxymethyl-2-hydroxymuconate isomerase